MEFHFIIKDCICISEDDLNLMAEQVKKGITTVEQVVHDYISGFDDYDYYHAFAYEDKIINEVRKRARNNKNVQGSNFKIFRRFRI